ncbi:hypothetical protein [Paracoccus niistensis]|uniref:Uncharacterized protein n=1 Tax=Paracoccus niistensis TaxID=632935 RepID=A0ABV6I5P1_9RHOB
MTREPDHNQTLIAAENGPVIEADDTGLVLRLSDRVIRDIARRIGLPAAAPDPVPAQPPSAAPERLDAALLGDIDAWDLQREGEWLHFLAYRPGPQGARRYRRHASGGGIIAETPGPVLGLLSLGAGRRMTTFGGTPDFPHHVVACHVPDEGEPDHLVHGWRNRGADTLLADALLALRHQAHRALPLIVALPVLLPPGPLPPADHPSVGAAEDQLRRLAKLASALEKPARLLAVGIEIGHDQAPTDAAGFHAEALGWLDLIAARIPSRDLGQPRFLMVADCGPWWAHDPERNRAAIEGQHRLFLRPGLHDVTPVAPSYMFAQDDLGQPTPEAMAERAALEAAALDSLLRRQPWTCPLLCLAEREGRTVRAVFKADRPLVIDPADPFGAGPGAGFALAGTTAGIAGVEIAPDDPQSVLIHLDGPLEPEGGAEPRLDYAVGGPARGRGTAHPAACGALRDEWALDRGGRTLRRWALPGSLVIR